MSHILHLQNENTGVVKRLYAAFTTHDVNAILLLLDRSVDWLFFGPAEIPFAGHYNGHDQVAAFFHRALETTDFLVFEPREFIAGTNSVLVQGYERAIAKSTGREWQTDWAHVFTLENGKITRLREYYDTAVMVEAFRSQ